MKGKEKMYYYKYVVELCCDDNEICSDCGITCGSTYNEAITRVINYHGLEEIKSIFLEEWAYKDCLSIDEYTLEQINK